MEIKEFEDNLTDLESRVDRLRALYENWFRGYEKLEPTVARKDCERRVYALRKELPRNTALRFRYNMLFQRYTTLSSYWTRTAKQVEEGTYRLQLRRLQRKGEKVGSRAGAKKRGQKSDAPGPGGYDLDLNESLDVSDLLDEHEMDAVAQAVDRPSPFAETPDTTQHRATGTFGRPKGLHEPMQNAGYAASGAKRDRPDAPPEFDRAPLAAQRTNVGIGGIPAPPLNVARGGVAGVPPPPSMQGGRPSAGSPPATITGGNGPARPSLPGGAKPPPPPLPGRTNPAPRAAPTAPAGGALSDQRMRRLYDEYTNARRTNNEGEVRYEALVRSIEKMLPELTKKHAGKQIDFDVVVKDGRVGLKPRAK